ncbi:molybdenum cofactor guanylyltransferase MobA [Gilvimarinus agarilyticus]|uniref:molybdenum cofactor guanylyltransferase MobA n=1 Tax=unclassified Gilvimarinus TaxID=2642066 RepID=UPI001C0908A2|nr:MULTISPECIES: molybdenum cofactor guanylyltransferase MobA [unclassified Gilvimarinus]MBU2884660.1 molybdenum cofactor guanylyltransferase MobA [Gilvimarinus agarilyticus]MDO6569767.1 molybdenum cofactor guanylyltransferase MobA [Gilvimarinus sp. 2_MG-2023]MDO6747419.1 molybdenum cofactor guanylyltransferase MobA [Gilvimarinus sp. 1_MG-2023]
MSANILPTGVLLAGGRARRMGGGDKCLLPLRDKTLLSRSIERAQPQVSDLLLSANGNALRFARTRLAVVPDEYRDFPGPMAGIHAALCWMQEHQPQSNWLASFACDTPFFPRDMVSTLVDALEADSQIAVCVSDGRMHPVFALWHTDLLPTISATLDQNEVPWLQHWIRDRPHVAVEFDTEPCDPFTNINTPQDLYAAEDLLAEHDNL